MGRRASTPQPGALPAPSAAVVGTAGAAPFDAAPPLPPGPSQGSSCVHASYPAVSTQGAQGAAQQGALTGNVLAVGGKGSTPAKPYPGWGQAASALKFFWGCCRSRQCFTSPWQSAFRTAGTHKGPVVQVFRILYSFADVVEGGADMAMTGMISAANATHDVAFWARSAIHGATLAANVYDIIDFVSVCVTKHSARFVVAHPSVLALWILTDLGSEVTGLSWDVRATVGASASTVGWFVPHGPTGKVVADPAYKWATIAYAVTLLRRGAS
jgi:hypothetical protein